MILVDFKMTRDTYKRKHESSRETHLRTSGKDRSRTSDGNDKAKRRKLESKPINSKGLLDMELDSLNSKTSLLENLEPSLLRSLLRKSGLANKDERVVLDKLRDLKVYGVAYTLPPDVAACLMKKEAEEIVSNIQKMWRLYQQSPPVNDRDFIQAHWITFEFGGLIE